MFFLFRDEELRAPKDVGHVLIVGLPHPRMLGTPMARRDAGPKGEHAYERHGSPSAGSYKRGGAVEDHAAIKRVKEMNRHAAEEVVGLAPCHWES